MLAVSLCKIRSVISMNPSLFPFVVTEMPVVHPRVSGSGPVGSDEVEFWSDVCDGSEPGRRKGK